MFSHPFSHPCPEQVSSRVKKIHTRLLTSLRFPLIFSIENLNFKFGLITIDISTYTGLEKDFDYWDTPLPLSLRNYGNFFENTPFNNKRQDRVASDNPLPT